MKIIIATIIQLILLIIGLPFFLMQKVGKFGIIAIEKGCNWFNWWGRR